MASSDDCPWKDEVREKLITIFEEDVEAFTRVLFYLDEEDNSYKDNSEIPPAWRSLKLLLNSDVAFKKYAERLVKKTKGDEEDVAFRNTMNQAYSELMDPSDSAYSEIDGETVNFDCYTHQNFNVARKTDRDADWVSSFMGLSHAWSLIPVSKRTEIVKMIPKLIENRMIISSVDEVVGFVNKSGGNHVMVALAAISLGYEAIKNLCRWWRGEITGVRCCKNIVDSTFTIAAGAVGGIGGAALGSFLGPIGTLGGGIIGGIISSQQASSWIDSWTQSIFGIPKDEALENAYNFFGVKMTASNYEINNAYRKLCLKHHPDKGGKSEDFLLVQIKMGVIKLARGGVF
jgi:hypothetical protein